MDISITAGGQTVHTTSEALQGVAGRIKKESARHSERQSEAFTPTEYGRDKYESVAADQLKAFIERIERLEEEKAGVAGDIREIFSEAKGNGFDTKVMRRVIALRRKDRAERQEEEAILELYLQALGMD